MHVLIPGHEVLRVSENTEQAIRIIIAADKVEVMVRKLPAPSVSPRSISPRKPASSPRYASRIYLYAWLYCSAPLMLQLCVSLR